MANRIVVIASAATTLTAVINAQNTAVAAEIAANLPQVTVTVTSDMDVAVNTLDTIANFCVMDIVSFQS